MLGTLGTALTIITAIGASLAGGIYLAFSTIVMPALRILPAGEASTTMRRINEMAVRAPFMSVFFGGAAAAAAVVVTQLVSDEPPTPGAIRTIGAGLVLASFVVTLVFNVPRNNVLASNTAASTTIAWETFDRGWSRANHLRGALAIVGAVVLTTSLVR